MLKVITSLKDDNNFYEKIHIYFYTMRYMLSHSQC